MALLKIARMGHPVLRRPADPVADPGDPEIRRLARDMIETMIDAPGVGLAAPQVHVPLRLIVFRVPADRRTPEEIDAAETEQGTHAAAPSPSGITVLINPVIAPIGDAVETAWEGCLSIPGLRGAVPRPAAIRYVGTGLDGTEIRREARGFHARVVQHETDHLDGVLYPDRMTDMSLLAFEDQLHHLEPDGSPRAAETDR